MCKWELLTIGTNSKMVKQKTLLRIKQHQAKLNMTKTKFCKSSDLFLPPSPPPAAGKDYWSS